MDLEQTITPEEVLVIVSAIGPNRDSAAWVNIQMYRWRLKEHQDLRL